MTPHRVNILSLIDFVWDASSIRYTSKRQDEDWMQMFEELMEYKEKHGDCLVPLNYKVNPKLGRWVQHQRSQYQNKKKGKTRQITDERIYKLEEIGFVWYRGWKKRDDEGWMLMFEQLVEYKEEHGDCLVPRKYEINAKLSNWVCHQRKHYVYKGRGKPTNLTDERIHKLQEIGFVWKLKTR